MQLIKKNINYLNIKDMFEYIVYARYNMGDKIEEKYRKVFADNKTEAKNIVSVEFPDAGSYYVVKSA